MSLPWTGKTGLAKLTTVFATGFLVSLGLCGANFIAVMSGFNVHPTLPNLLLITAWLETAGMLICAVGLLVIGIIKLVQYLRRRPTSPPK